MYPYISLIIPVYNTGMLLERCLNSAVAQTEQSLEIICVDDASTDGSAAMLDAFAEKDSRLRVFHQKVNGGEAAARNRGVALARGEYLSFLDHDDILAPNACRLLADTARATRSDIVKGRVKTVDGNGNICLSPLELHKYICEKSKFFFAFSWWSGIYHSRLIKERIFFAEEYPIGGDLLFLTEVLLAAKSITCIDDIVYTHFLHSGSNSGGIFTPEKMRSVIDCRLRIMNIIHDAEVDAVDKEGYLYKINNFFREGVSLINHNCDDDTSRAECCEYLFKLYDMHKYPHEFLLYIRKDFPILEEFFISHSLIDLQEFVQRHKVSFKQQTSVLETLRRAVRRDMRAKARL